MLRGIQEINKERKGIGIYARVSTQEQRDTGYSIDMQIGKIDYSAQVDQSFRLC